MYDTKDSAVSTKHDALYKTVLLLYPTQYRKRFGQEMLFVFEDMYQEELAKHGRVGTRFWLSVFIDTIGSVIAQHIDMIRKQGMKNYLQQTLHINKYNVIGGILLLPFIVLLGSDFIGRVIQGDFSHPNMTLIGYLSRSILYSGQAPLLWVVLVYSPLLAILLNIIPFITSLKKKNKKLVLTNILFVNPLALVIMGMGFLFLVVAFGHDVIPCFVHRFFSSWDLFHTIAICKNA